MNGCVVHCFDDLIVQAAQREERLSAPFSVYIHGDFNLDNVIYDPVSAKIRFIDLHRSRYMDYVQDVSVFMVSNYRLQVLDRSTRQRIARVATDIHQMASKFARRQKDATYDYRLGPGTGAIVCQLDPFCGRSEPCTADAAACPLYPRNRAGRARGA